MIFNMILMFLLIGWSINAAVFQAQRKFRLTQFWLNAFLAVAAGLWFAARLS